MGGSLEDLQAAFRLRPTGIQRRIGRGPGFWGAHLARGQAQHRGLGQGRGGPFGLGGHGFKHAVNLVELRRIAECGGGLLGEVVLGFGRLDLWQSVQRGPPSLRIHGLDQCDHGLRPGRIGRLGRVGGPHQQRHGLGRDVFRLRQLTRHRRQQAGFGSGPRQKGFEGITGGNAMAGKLAPDERRLAGLGAVQLGFQGRGDAGRAFPGFRLVVGPAGVRARAPGVAFPRTFLEMQAAECGDQSGAAGFCFFGRQSLNECIGHTGLVQRLEHPQGGGAHLGSGLRLIHDLQAGIDRRDIGQGPHDGVGDDGIGIGQMADERRSRGRTHQAGGAVGGRPAHHRIR